DGWPLPYHLVTILLHATLALLLFQILRRLNIPGAWLGAAIFALHPVHVESVAWLSEVKNTLSGALAAAATLAYLKYDKDRQLTAYFLAFALFLAGLMTKTAIVTLPIVLLIVFWWKRGKLAWERDFKPLVPFFGVAIVAGIVTVWVAQKFCVEHGVTFDFGRECSCGIGRFPASALRQWWGSSPVCLGRSGSIIVTADVVFVM